MVRKIVDVKSPILRQKAKPVAKIDKKIKELVADMQDTLVAQSDPEGVGLAAPQVGKSLQLFVVDYKNLKRVVINPAILEVAKVLKTKTKKSKKILEGCLSLPNFYGPIKRTHKVKLQYMDLEGKKTTEEFEGFNAQIIMHEMDHLNGVLFIDRILEQKAPLYKFEGDDWEEVELP
jgi:peptide deformylase